MGHHIDVLARIAACGDHMQDVHDEVQELIAAVENADCCDYSGASILRLERAIDRTRPLNMVSSAEGS